MLSSSPGVDLPMREVDGAQTGQGHVEMGTENSSPRLKKPHQMMSILPMRQTGGDELVGSQMVREEAAEAVPNFDGVL